MDVRTIKDIAERISAIVSRASSKKSAPKPAAIEAPVPEQPPVPEAAEEAKSVQRIVFREAPLENGTIQPVEVTPMDWVAVLSAAGGTGLRKRVGDVIRRDYGSSYLPVSFLEEKQDPEVRGFDFRTKQGPDQACAAIGQTESLAGLVFIVDEELDNRLENIEDVSRLLKGLFLSLKTFLESPAKKFAILIHKSQKSKGLGRLLAEGVLGMFLSAAQEFSSVQFRTIRLDEDSDLRDSIRGALDRSQKTIETIYANDELSTTEGVPSPSVFKESRNLELSPEDVVVFSGGCSGITPFLARSLVPFGCKLVFLGRTVLSETSKGLEIARTLENLRSSGVEADYFSCDVNDSGRVDAVIHQIVKRF
jgi:hypothetical protein